MSSREAKKEEMHALLSDWLKRARPSKPERMMELLTVAEARELTDEEEWELHEASRPTVSVPAEYEKWFMETLLARIEEMDQ